MSNFQIIIYCNIAWGCDVMGLNIYPPRDIASVFYNLETWTQVSNNQVQPT